MVHRLPSLPPSLFRNALALAIAQAGAATLGVCALAMPIAVLAQAQDARSFDIPPGPLEDTLNRFGREAGILLSFSPEVTAGVQSPGVRGRHGVQAGLAAVLAGTGVQSLPQANGTILLRRSLAGAGKTFEVTAHANDGQTGSLQTVTVSGKALGSTTEGTGAYTSRSSSSSTRLNLAPNETPQALTVITRQQLEDMNATNLTEVLDTAAGIHVAQNGIGSEIYGFSTRGFSIESFEVDGVPTDSGLNLFTQNPVIYDRIEVVRGATGLISGMGNPAATINMIRKRPTVKPQASISVAAGNWSRRATTLDASGKLNESGSVRGRLVADVRDQKGWVDRFQQQSHTLYGIVEADLDDATLLTVGFNHQRSDADSPQRWGIPALYADGRRVDLPRSLNYAPNWSYHQQQFDGVFASVEREWAQGWTSKAEYSYTQNDYDFTFAAFRGSLQPDGSGITLQPYRWAGKAHQHNLDLYLTGDYTLFGRQHELIGGLTLSRYEGLTPNYANSFANPADARIAHLLSYDGNSAAPGFTRTSTTSLKRNSNSAYASTRLHLNDALKVILGGRLVHWDRDVRTWNAAGTTSTIPSQQKVFVPYVGMVYNLDPQWAGYASVTKIFQPQGQWIRSATNEDLDPMEGTGYEIGIKGSHFGGRLNSNAALFLTQQDNLAVWHNSISNYTLEKGVTAKGLELEFSGEVARNWQLAASYTHTDSTDAQGVQLTSWIPRNLAKLQTSYRLSGALQGLTLGGSLRWQSKTGRDGVWQGHLAIASLLARYEVDSKLSFTLNVDNLFDRTYYNYPSSNSTYAAPRSVMVSAKYNF